MASNSIVEQCKEQPLAQPVMQIVALTHFLTSVQTTLEQVQAILPKSSDPTPFRLPACFAYERFDEIHILIGTTLEKVSLVREGLSSPSLLTSGAVHDEGIADRVLRRRLPDERESITHKFSIGGHEGYLTVGMYEDGSPGEIFITMAKEGSPISGLMDSIAVAVSLTLQYGVSLSFLVERFAHVRFEPSGWTSNRQIPYAKSIVDYIFRWLGLKFLGPEYLTSDD